MNKLMTTIIIKIAIILNIFHSIINISFIKEIQLITSAWCVYNHHTQLLVVLSTKKYQSPNLDTATSFVHWETTITSSDHCYQICPLREHNHHIWSLLPVLSTEIPQSPYLITVTSFVHWDTTSDHYIWSLLSVMSTE